MSYNELLQEMKIIRETNPEDTELQHLMTFDTEIQKPPSLVSIADPNGYDVDMFTLGNISLIKGKAKSRKSFFISAISAVSIQGHCGLESFKGTDVNKPYVLFFDTEMSLYHSQRMGFSVIRQIDPELKQYYKHYTLRELSPAQRLNFIDNVLSKYDGQFSMVIIDGIVDLLSHGINDEPEAIAITNKLMKWSSLHNCHILLVLHENKNDTNARGHIGTSLTNKCETVLKIEKDKRSNGISLVSAEYTRGGDFEPFAFELTENFIPTLTHYSPVKTKREETIELNFRAIFQDQNHCTYKSLIEKYVLVSNKSEPSAKRAIAEAVKNGIIMKDEKYRTYKMNIALIPDSENSDEILPF